MRGVVIRKTMRVVFCFSFFLHHLRPLGFFPFACFPRLHLLLYFVPLVYATVQQRRTLFTNSTCVNSYYFLHYSWPHCFDIYYYFIVYLFASRQR
ncbi:hypothetical protein BDF19DRAFT_89817 [Syncephalis fuscata]|nr:hypothetical protein BDF19DRAFT_89817 [Syncephalis fuscata]